MPIGAARFILLAREEYPLAASLPALLWSQLLLFAAALPVVALAAVTSGTMEFSLAALGVAVAYLMALFVTPYTVRFQLWPVSVEWFRDALAFSLLTALAAALLFWQYRERRTGLSRIFGVASVGGSAVLYLLLPISAGFVAQTWLSRADVPPLQVAPDLTKRTGMRPQTNQDVADRLVRVPVDLTITGMPAGVETAADAVSVKLEWPDGRKWRGSAGLSGLESAPRRVSVRASIAIPNDLFQRIREPARMRGSLYLTLFGDARSRTIPVSSYPVNALDGLQCNTEPFNTYFCRAFFGWPSLLVYAKYGEVQSEFTRLVSYSPFPSGPDLDATAARYTTLGSTEAAEVTIITKRPLAHFRRDFDFAGVRLADFIGPGAALPPR
jgi:hypothetical protein